MDKYTDDQWLDIVGRQYEVAMAAHCDLENVVAEDLARRTGANIERVRHALNLTDNPTLTEANRSWLEEVIAVNEQIRALMGDGYELLRERFNLMYQVVDSCGWELAKHLGGDRERHNDMLNSYACERRDGYSEGFAAYNWKTEAEDEQTRSRINAAAERDDADEVSRLLLVDRDLAVGMVDTYRKHESSETFATWAWSRLEQQHAE